MNFDLLQSEVLKAIRGGITQAQLSRDLGLAQNQVYLWESGRVGLYWDDFVLLCQTCQIPLAQVLYDFLEIPFEVNSGHEVAKAIVGMNKIEELAEQIDRSKHVIYRWISGLSKPKLSDILLLLYKCTNFLIEFLAALVDYRELPLVMEEAERRERERQFHYSYPLMGAIIRCFELTEYEGLPQHSSALIAKHCGVSELEVDTLIRMADEADLLEKVGGLYKVKNKSLAIKGNRLGRSKIIDYWLQRQKTALPLTIKASDQTPDGHNSYLLFTTNTKTYQKIEALTQQYRRALFALLHDDDNRSTAAPLDRIVLWQHYLGDLKNMAELEPTK